MKKDYRIIIALVILVVAYFGYRAFNTVDTAGTEAVKSVTYIADTVKSGVKYSGKAVKSCFSFIQNFMTNKITYNTEHANAKNESRQEFLVCSTQLDFKVHIIDDRWLDKVYIVEKEMEIQQLVNIEFFKPAYEKNMKMTPDGTLYVMLPDPYSKPVYSEREISKIFWPVGYKREDLDDVVMKNFHFTVKDRWRTYVRENASSIDEVSRVNCEKLLYRVMGLQDFNGLKEVKVFFEKEIHSWKKIPYLNFAGEMVNGV